MHVSLVGRRDLAGEIYRQLREAILAGRLHGGEPLPPTRVLAARLNVARTTVSVAYDRLVSEGFATGRVGAGTFVSPNVARTELRAARNTALQPRDLWRDVRLPAEMWQPVKYDFRSGAPDERLFPYGAWRRLFVRECRPRSGDVVYGHPAGDPRLRAAIVRHLAVSRGVQADPEDVIVTNGAQQAIDLIARVLLAPGDQAAVEDPGYGPPRRLLRALGLRVDGVPVDDEGLQVEAIPSGARLVYVSPSHQFPLGMPMSLPRRIALLEWARRSGGAIVEDDYDSEFRFGGRPIEPLHMLDNDGRVLYVGSFSKTMSPSLRLGFLIAPASLRTALHAAKHVADWHTPLVVQGMMARFIEEGGFARHVRRMRRTYDTRHRTIIQILSRDFADELEVVPSFIGLHVTARALNASVERIDKVMCAAATEGCVWTALSLYAAGETKQAGVVLGYGGIAPEEIPAGLRVLRRAFDMCGR